MVPRHHGYHNPAFPATQGTTQGGLVSPALFNVAMDNTIRTWLSMPVEDRKVAHDGLVEATVWCLGVLYADGGMVGSREIDWLQKSMNVLVRLFQPYGLADNVAKSFLMTCKPGTLRLGMSAEVKDLKCLGVVYSYHMRIRRHIPCMECRFELTVGSMTERRHLMHGTEPAIDRKRFPVIQTEHHTQVYDVRFQRSKKWCP